ncbi:spore gernimation protein [Photobacterium minamisatsumaniensis]|uniref:spore gernimation protein n=1 Tax=Photobacterium minamisatsumaniensis TaxID=2910233 RepID=UPI003D1082D0
MKQGMKAGIVFLLLAFVTGCSEELQLTTTPIQNVEKIQVTANTLDVYCVTGICKFELSANMETQITVNMHYSDTKTFEKIEGVSVTGKMGSTVKVVDENTFEMALAGSDAISKIQVVDYYRN